MKFVVDKKFFEMVPDACFGVIITRGFDNSKNYPEIENFLKDEIAKAQNYLQDKKVKELKEIELYREAFRKLNINPNKFMCSIEALLTRVGKAGFIPSINLLVDLGNALSIKYHIPLGIHDIDKIPADIELRFANESDRFIPFGQTEAETPDLNEVIYVSGNDVRTRRWTWRQGENGKIDGTAKDVFIPIDGFIENKEEVLKLQAEFKNYLEKMGATCELGFVDKDNNIYTF